MATVPAPDTEWSVACSASTASVAPAATVTGLVAGRTGPRVPVPRDAVSVRTSSGESARS